MEFLSEKLKELRLEKGITQKEIASYIGVSTSAYGYYEQGKSIPSPDIIVNLSDYFSVSTDYLLSKSDYKYGVESILSQFHAIKNDNLNIDRLRLSFEEMLFIINNNEKLDITQEQSDIILNELISYLEYKIYKFKL